MGGAGGAVGPGFEVRAVAWFAAHLVARIPLPAIWRVNAACVEEIGGQTGQEMDDLGAITERRGYTVGVPTILEPGLGPGYSDEQPSQFLRP